jgi:hypothetical protein
METTTRAAACAPAPNRQFPSPTCRGCRLKTHAPRREPFARALPPLHPRLCSRFWRFHFTRGGRQARDVGVWLELRVLYRAAPCDGSLARQPPPLPSRPAKRQLHPGRQRQTATPPERGVFGPGRTRKRRELRGQAGGKGRGQCVAPRTGPRPAPAGRGERRAVMPLPGI